MPILNWQVMLVLLSILADIYIVANEKGEQFALKIHRFYILDTLYVI